MGAQSSFSENQLRASPTKVQCYLGAHVLSRQLSTPWKGKLAQFFAGKLSQISSWNSQVSSFYRISLSFHRDPILFRRETYVVRS